MTPLPKNSGFAALGLPDALLQTIQNKGYATPTPIQELAIPALLNGQDVLGQAQTGTGKTAAFALPLLTKINIKRRAPQILVLTPTRELALQVAEAFSSYAVNLPGITILPVYGGQGYSTQLSMLRKGVHIIIGTPGRIMDHMRNEALNLEHIKVVILDEADEMLRMGFAEDVEWILQQIPAERQIGLFSATLPAAIKKIAEKYLHDPQRITVKTKTSTAATIKQFYIVVNGSQKTDALSRIIETEDSAAMIVFVRTKRATEDLAEQLVARGFNAVAINGDIVQKQRERVIEQLKSGKINILVATDVAARGIDVERITHVINYDAPTNSESYVHRIGRTGRAGRAGTAIIMVSPREKYILRNIEQATKQPIEALPVPSVKTINTRRMIAFKQRITDALTTDIEEYQNLLQEYCVETNTSAIKVAAALAKMVQGDKEFLLSKNTVFSQPAEERPARRTRSAEPERGRGRSSERSFGVERERGRGRSSERSSGVERESERGRGRSAERSSERSPGVGRETERGRGRSAERSSGVGRESERGRGRSAERSSGVGRESERGRSSERSFGVERDRKRNPEFKATRPSTTTNRDTNRKDDTRSFKDRPKRDFTAQPMEQYRLDVGRDHGISPKNLVGAIANTAGIEGKLIGKIKIDAKYSTIDLPKGMPRNVLQTLQKIKLGGKQMNLTKVSAR